MDRLDRILNVCREHVPGIRLVYKAEVPWMRLVGKLARPFSPDFDTRFTTVVGDTVYLPCPVDEFPRDALAATLAHELIHQQDQRRWGLLFYVSYGAAMPVGRTYRAYWERRAYAVDLLLAHERGGPMEVLRVADILATVFAGSAYLWMWAGARSAREYLQPIVDRVLDGSLELEDPYREILAAWRGPADDAHYGGDSEGL